MRMRILLALLATLALGQAVADTKTRVASPIGIDPYPSSYQPLPQVDTLITNATVLDGAGRRLDNASILLREGKVAGIGTDLVATPGVKVIEAAGRWVTPGIIDIHSHNGILSSPYTLKDYTGPTIDVNERSDANSANVWAEHSLTIQDPAFTRGLAAGVTTLHVLPGSSNLFGGRTVVLKNVPAVTVQQMKFPGAPQGLKMACGENPKNNYGERNQLPSSRMGNIAGFRDAWIKAQQYREKWRAYTAGETKNPPDRDLKLDTLASALAGDIRIHVHCYRADDMAVMLDVAREFGYRITAFHHATESFKIADQLREAGTCAVVWSDWWGFKIEAFDAIRENAALTDAAGACVMMHSDSAILQQRLNLETAKAVAAGNRAGLAISPEHAIRWITSGPADALGIGDRTGTLEAGKNADVVIWSGNPFSVYSRVQQVFIDGALVYDHADPARRPISDFEVGQPVLEPRP